MKVDSRRPTQDGKPAQDPVDDSTSQAPDVAPAWLTLSQDTVPLLGGDTRAQAKERAERVRLVLGRRKI